MCLDAGTPPPVMQCWLRCPDRSERHLATAPIARATLQSGGRGLIGPQHPQLSFVGQCVGARGGPDCERLHGQANVPVPGSSTRQQCLSTACRNRVGTVGTAVETALETVANHVETVNSLFEGFQF